MTVNLAALRITEKVGGSTTVGTSVCASPAKNNGSEKTHPESGQNHAIPGAWTDEPEKEGESQQGI